MATLIRKLTKKIWMDVEIAQQLGGLQADALKNFQTTNNNLSLFYVDETCSAERIASVIALGRQSIDNVDYVVFEDAVLESAKVRHRRADGDTADARVNQNHVDIIKLTAEQVKSLAQEIQARGTFSRLTKPRIISLLKQLHESGCLDGARIDASILKKIT